MAKGKKKGDGHADQDDLVFKALAGADRRKILDLLRDGPMTTGEIDKRLPSLDRTTVMQHLRCHDRQRASTNSFDRVDDLFCRLPDSELWI